jgi:leader peptidase (prepilin peptidase) / N-methyltransferase
LVVAGVGGVLGVIDARSQRLPDRLTLPLIASTAVLLATDAIVGGNLLALRDAIVGGTGLTAAYLLLHAINPRGLGLGDVKLAAALGLLAGWHGSEALALAAVLPFALASLAALALIATKRANRHTALAFGPWMLIGTAAAILVGYVAA